ncbi:MAG: replicative DNA helicase [Lentisphaerae bacterium]|nr:replicative DNA helicase [Lentisphaerota bacterium]
MSEEKSVPRFQTGKDGRAEVRRNAASPVAERPSPHNLDVERAVLSAMLRDPAYCGSKAVELLGNADTFYSQVHREIFSAYMRLYATEASNIDILALSAELQKSNKLESCGGLPELAKLENAIASTYNFERWCVMLRDLYTLRSMINVCSDSIRKCYEAEKDAAELVNEIENAIYKVRGDSDSTSIVSLKDSAWTAFAHIERIINKQEEPGIMSGFPDLDKMTGGLKRGEMFVVAARPSIGKTALALNIIRNIVMKNNPKTVILFSLEMTDEQISTRLICTEADMSERNFRDGSFRNGDMPKLANAVKNLRNAPLFIDPTGGLTIAELRAKARRMKIQHKIDLIVIDYLQLMQGSGHEESRQREVSEISSGIKSLAKELQIPVMVLAQLNREVEKGTASTMPKLSHLRESGSIEQDADVVVFLHRDRDKAKNLPPGASVEAKLIVEKNRNGETGYVDLEFYPSRMEFVNVRYHSDDRPAAEKEKKA